MLTKKEQIIILKEVLEVLNNKTDDRGLCYIIAHRIAHRIIIPLNLLVYRLFINDYIPLFTKENAIKYGNAHKNNYSAYWWNHPDWWDTSLTYDYENRILFVNWMISELEKEK